MERKNGLNWLPRLLSVLLALMVFLSAQDVLAPVGHATTESELDGFNFDTIWEMKDGRPVLRIFQ